MKFLAMLIGLMGCFLSIYSPYIGIVPLILGALMFAGAVRRERAATEERRHQEILAAMKSQKQG